MLYFPLSNIAKEQKPNTGNYYIFFSGNPSLSTGNATDSICPYGWQLAEYDGDKSFQNLLVATYRSKNGDGQSNADTLVQNSPTSFLRSGYYNYDSGALGSRGLYGGYWSLLGYSGTNARYLGFNSAYFHPQSGYNRGDGFAVRCLVR